MNPAEWMRKIWYLLNRRRLEREMELEMETHRELMEEAGSAARKFGDDLRIREQTRDVWGWNWLDTAWQDARYALRTMTPGYLLTAGLILSLGIGLNLALFQIVNVVLLQTPPYKDPGSLVRFERLSKHYSSSGVPYRETQFVRANNKVLSAVLTRAGSDVAWGDDASDRVRAAFVSANWFDELGYGAARGRVFFEEIDERADASPAVVLSHDFWRMRFGGDESVVGKTIRLNNRAATVVGVASAEFPDVSLDAPPQVWMPIHQIDYFDPGTDFKNSWTSNVVMLGRLRSGVSPAEAKDALRATINELSRQYPQQVAESEWLEPYRSSERFQSPKDLKQIWGVALIAGGLTVLVLLVACANLGNLMLSRATGRMRELSVRAALGASRWRIVRQLLMESLLLAVLGSLGGLFLGIYAARMISAFAGLPSAIDFSPDGFTLAAALAIVLLATLAVGLAPAWSVSRQDLVSSMKDGGQQSSSSLQRTRIRKALVTAQVAGSCLLLVMAGLMSRGLQRLLTGDPGFEYEQVATMDPSLERYGIRGEAARDWWRQVRQTLAAQPEVEGIAIVSLAPLGRSLSEASFLDAPKLKITEIRVEPGFFKLMRVPVLAGRDFNSNDDPRGTVIISKRAALEMYGRVNVVGEGFPKRKPEQRIVGVTGDAHLIKIQATNVAEMYKPLVPEDFRDYLLIARSRTTAGRLMGPMRQAARGADDRVLAKTTRMSDDFQRRIRPLRLTSSIAMFTGLLALALACLGIYGVVSYGAAARTKEIGIRVALGAPQAGILRLLLRQHASLLLLGMMVGMAGAVSLSLLLRGDPFYLEPADVPVHVTIALVFGLTVGAATVWPALRALRLDPLRALRQE